MDWTGQAAASRVKLGAGGSDLLALGWPGQRSGWGETVLLSGVTPPLSRDHQAPRSCGHSGCSRSGCLVGQSVSQRTGCPLRKPLLLTLLCLPHPGTASTGKPSQPQQLQHRLSQRDLAWAQEPGLCSTQGGAFEGLPVCLLHWGPQRCSRWLWAGPTSWLQGEAPGGEAGSGRRTTPGPRRKQLLGPVSWWG